MLIAPHRMKFGGGARREAYINSETFATGNLKGRPGKTLLPCASRSLLRLYRRASDKQFKTTVGSRKHFWLNLLRTESLSRFIVILLIG